jgi:hypothetical protein
MLGSINAPTMPQHTAAVCCITAAFAEFLYAAKRHLGGATGVAEVKRGLMRLAFSPAPRMAPIQFAALRDCL